MTGRGALGIIRRMESLNVRNKVNRGIFLVTLSALCWSLNSPLVKSLEMDAFMLTGMRALIAGVALAAFLRPKKIRWRSKNTWLMVLFYSIHCTLIVLALKNTSAPIAVAMQFTAPVWLFFWEGKYKQKPELAETWPLIVMLLGMVLFMFSKGTGVGMLGNILAACSSLSFAALTYFSKRTAMESDNPIGLTSLSNLITAAVVLLFFVKDMPTQLAALTPSQWPVLLILGAVQTGGGYAFYFLGLKDVDSGTASMISPLEMVLGPLWVALFLREYPDIIALIAFVFVIAGVAGEVIVARKQARS